MPNSKLTVIEMTPIPAKAKAVPQELTLKTVKERVHSCRVAEGVDGKQWRPDTKAQLKRDGLAVGLDLRGGIFDTIEVAPAD